jgi:hypothetical protein
VSGIENNEKLEGKAKILGFLVFFCLLLGNSSAGMVLIPPIFDIFALCIFYDVRSLGI